MPDRSDSSVESGPLIPEFQAAALGVRDLGDCAVIRPPTGADVETSSVQTGRHDTLSPMNASSWLFVKGDESIRIACPSPTVLSVSGPGTTRARYTFDGVDAVQAYQIELAEEFSSGGWVLIGENYDRRSGGERRSLRRSGEDRRLNASASTA